jgi:hypothetical protein
MIEVWSRHRRVRLATPPAEPWAMQILAVPDGSTDVQVLEAAAQVLDPAALAELREVIEREAGGRPAGSTTQPSPGSDAR